MQTGKSKSKQKTRQPYAKVTEVGQVPIALQEISEIASGIKPDDGPISLQSKAKAIKNMADSIITVTCANPGCLSQMAEDLILIPIEQAFTCHVCDTEIIINQDDPKRRMFEWTDGTTGEKHPCCFDCDDILIQDGELPNAKKKQEVQS